MKKTHSRILAAAYKLFSDRGFNGTTMDAIALDAGVSRKTLFNYLASKDAILWEIARFWYEQTPPAQTPENANQPALALIRQTFVEQLTMLEAHRPFMTMVLTYSSGMDIDQALLRPGQEPNDRCMAEALALFRLAGQRGELRHGVTAETAYQAYSAVRNLVVRRWLLLPEYEPQALAREADSLLDVLFSGFAKPSI
ncbi:MAG TPA: TetR family transcriptional regulator [Pseudomonadales bacterium]